MEAAQSMSRRKPTNPMTRENSNGKFEYKSQVIRNGKAEPEIFTDFFASDEAASAGLAEILRSMGQNVVSVEIDFPVSRIFVKSTPQ